MGGKFSNVKVKTPEDALLALMSVRTVMSVEGQEFGFIKVVNDDDHCTYCLQQLYKGIPVDRGVYRVVVSSEGEPQYVRGEYEPGIDLDIHPAIDADKAFKKYGKDDKIDKTTLVIYSTRSVPPTLAWEYLVNVLTDDEKYILLDANTGEFFEERPMVIH